MKGEKPLNHKILIMISEHVAQGRAFTGERSQSRFEPVNFAMFFTCCFVHLFVNHNNLSYIVVLKFLYT